jgi:3-deoxy-D-manno-octulosonate 8-phosphate phosphatase (KDO 8-P phosphatase)
MGSDFSSADIGAAFSALGGVFVTPAERIAERAAACRAVVLDWDGVFNAGAKGEGAASPFSEADSMGINLLRYGLWRAHGRLPVAAVITGEQNETATRFATREHFDAIYAGVKNKIAALEHLCVSHSLRADETIVVFDDVNDLGMAAQAGVRVLVRREASPLLTEYVVRHRLADYVTGSRADAHAVREAAELVLGLLRRFDEVVHRRSAWDPDYVRYFEARQAVETRFEHAP